MCRLLKLFLFICVPVIGIIPFYFYAGYWNSSPFFLFAGYWNSSSFFFFFFFFLPLLEQFLFISMPVIGTVPLYLYTGSWNSSSLFVCRVLEQFLFIRMPVIATVSLCLVVVCSSSPILAVPREGRDS